LNVNLARFSRTELEDAVAILCAQFGTVESVRVLRTGTQRRFALAVVAMASLEEADKVVVNVGYRKFGACAILRLMQEEAQTPVPAADIRIAGTQKRLN
jgi:hypothetical protein